MDLIDRRSDDLIDEVVDFLYEGAVDPREVRDIISKMEPDASDVHTQRTLKRKKRETEFGLGNNLFGAAAGTAATVQAYNAAKRIKPKDLKKTRTGRLLLKTKVNPKIAIPAAGTAMVGSQLINGAMDAQSAQYFARERIRLQKEGKKKVKKSFVPATITDLNEDETVWEGEISKIDEDKRQVFGWCSVTKVNGQDVYDRQNDFIPLDEVEKSAYKYVISSRKGGDMHQRAGEEPLHTSDMIESFVVTPEKLEKLGLEPDAIPHGWWVGFTINDDDQWSKVKNGERTAFSIHGKGRRVEKMIG